MRILEQKVSNSSKPETGLRTRSCVEDLLGLFSGAGGIMEESKSKLRMGHYMATHEMSDFHEEHP